MLVSWKWLQQYVNVTVSPEELATRLMMAGLNHESTSAVDDDLCIDLEVTSNRPDCLGHIGIAREAAVLLDLPLAIPSPQPRVSKHKVSEYAHVTVECPDLCSRYTARVIKGVRIGPSPDWLASRLRTIGCAVINNVVDITNYVLMECGQPLHAFDLRHVTDGHIIVRRGRKDEKFEAIDHKTYTLDESMCVIADSTRALALAGVMGGADSEVTGTTTDLLIESADFDQLTTRTTARRLSLRSPSSYRFERGVDPAGVDWASWRCCELILNLAGGDLAAGVIDVDQPRPERQPIVLRFSQLPRILGIEVGNAEVSRILQELGCEQQSLKADHIEVVAPTWRRDLTREIDLVEEVARIHGYDKIPEDVAVPMAPSHRTDADRVLAKVRQVLTAAGFDEAMTRTIVSEEWSAAFSPWTHVPPLVASTPMVKGEDRVRRSLIPSLLGARRINEAIANDVCELFETARIYLPHPPRLPLEQWTLGIVSGKDFRDVKGTLENLLDVLHITGKIQMQATKQPLLDDTICAELRLDDTLLGFMGKVGPAGLKKFGLRSPTMVAEIDLNVLLQASELVPVFSELSPFPAMTRDLNLIVDESVQWGQIVATVRENAGPQLEQVTYLETYRDPKKDGANKKRFIFSMGLRASDRTLTSDEADAARDQVVAACHAKHQAVLLS